jgi:TonB family protein
MPKNVRFWTNVGLIAAAHAAIIVGLIRLSHGSQEVNGQGIVWMNGGTGDGIVADKKIPTTIKSPALRKESKTDPLKDRDADEDRPFLASAPSEIQLPMPKPSATATPRMTPNVKGTPKPKPKPSPKPTQKPTLKPKEATVAKAKPLPKSKHEEKAEAAAKSEMADAEKKKTVLVKNETPAPKPAVTEKSSATQTGSGKGTTAGVGGDRAGGSVNESQFGWYGSMLHDRFYSEWAQPSIENAVGKNSALVKLRIEKDGRVSSFEIVRSSGNPELDDSVKAIASRVSHVEPLPDGLGKGDHYDVKINFELNSE